MSGLFAYAAGALIGMVVSVLFAISFGRHRPVEHPTPLEAFLDFMLTEARRNLQLMLIAAVLAVVVLLSVVPNTTGWSILIGYLAVRGVALSVEFARHRRATSA